MTSKNVPSKSVTSINNQELRRWLERAQIENFECGQCDGIHLSALDSGEGPVECRVMHRPEALMLLTQVELRPSAILPMGAFAGVLCAEFPEIKVHVECPDEEVPSLVISHAAPHLFKLEEQVFVGWIRWYLVQTQQIIDEARHSGLLGNAPEQEASAGGHLH